MRRRYVPQRGDLVWLSFNPQAGHEQAGRRPALVVSPSAYNGRVGLALCCPVTSHAKGYPFEVRIPAGREVQGVILSDQVRSLDWHARQAKFIDRLPTSAVAEVIELVTALLSGGQA